MVLHFEKVLRSHSILQALGAGNSRSALCIKENKCYFLVLSNAAQVAFP